MGCVVWRRYYWRRWKMSPVVASKWVNREWSLGSLTETPPNCDTIPVFSSPIRALTNKNYPKQNYSSSSSSAYHSFSNSTSSFSTTMVVLVVGKWSNGYITHHITCPWPIITHTTRIITPCTSTSFVTQPRLSPEYCRYHRLLLVLLLLQGSYLVGLLPLFFCSP